MMKIIAGLSNLAVLAGVALSLVTTSCSGSNKSNGGLPKDFNDMSDNERVEYMMQQVTPDSVARFIYNASLGRVDGARIDTLANAVLYCYEHYTGDDLNSFADEIDEFPKSLSPVDKMKIYTMTGEYSADSMGLRIGLEYVAQIRENKLTTKDIDRDLAALKEATADNPDNYEMFLKGFKTALAYDRGKDLSEEIYNRYINIE